MMHIVSNAVVDANTDISYSIRHNDSFTVEELTKLKVRIYPTTVIEKDGKDILIGFNPKFLIDALKVIDDEVIHMYLMNPKAPCFIRDDEENYTYLILPVNISQNQNR